MLNPDQNSHYRNETFLTPSFHWSPLISKCSSWGWGTSGVCDMKGVFRRKCELVESASSFWIWPIVIYTVWDSWEEWCVNQNYKWIMLYHEVLFMVSCHLMHNFIKCEYVSFPYFLLFTLVNWNSSVCPCMWWWKVPLRHGHILGTHRIFKAKYIQRWFAIDYLETDYLDITTVAFLGGLPSNYYPGPTLLTFCDLMRSR